MDLSVQMASPQRVLQLKTLAETVTVNAPDKGKNTKGGWKTMPFIIGNEACANLAVVSLTANLVVYLTTQYYLDRVTAANITSIWAGTTYLAPILGAFIADSYLGQFWAIIIASLIYIIAMSLVTVISLLPQLRPPTCSSSEIVAGTCEAASNGQLGLLFMFLVLMAIGSSGTKSCLISFGADQFNGNDAKEKKEMQSFFNWYYFAASVSVMMGLTIVVYIQNSVDWSLGFGVATLLMVISTAFFLMGIKQYIYVNAEGSPFSALFQVIVASIRKRRLQLPSDARELYAIANTEAKSPVCSTNQLRFLNKAAIITKKDFPKNGSSPNPWKLCTVQKIEELKSIILVLPIWSAGIVVAIILSQQHTFGIYQAQLMNKKIGSKFETPAGSYTVFTLLAVAMWLPLYDRVIIRLFRRIRKRSDGITVLERIGTGLVISANSMVVAGLVEVKRKNSAIPISAFWLAPQYLLSGLAEAFYAIGLIEFFYGQFPDSLRSTAVALFWCSIGIGLYMSSVVVSLVHKITGGNGRQNWLAEDLNQGRLEYFYWLLAGLGLINVFYFIFCTHWLKYKSNVQPTIEDRISSEDHDKQYSY